MYRLAMINLQPQVEKMISQAQSWMKKFSITPVLLFPGKIYVDIAVLVEKAMMRFNKLYLSTDYQKFENMTAKNPPRRM